MQKKKKKNVGTGHIIKVLASKFCHRAFFKLSLIQQIFEKHEVCKIGLQWGLKM